MKESEEARSASDEREGLSGPAIFRAIAREGREELSRPAHSLWWSAVAAGLVISLSYSCKSFLHASLPDAPWRNAVSSLGYTVGFVVVILGRLQLFTENTITTVLPLLEDKSMHALRCVARLWGIVALGNLVGCFLAAALSVSTTISSADLLPMSLEVAEHYADRSLWQMLGNGVPAGFIVAAMVWSSPASGSSRFWVIVLLSYMISAGNMTHVVAGSTELFSLLLAGRMGVLEVALGTLATGVGNVLGGTVFFSILAYGQARDEL